MSGRPVRYVHYVSEDPLATDTTHVPHPRSFIRINGQLYRIFDIEYDPVSTITIVRQSPLGP